MMKIKKGDTVVITAGKDRTKTGKILRVFFDGGKVIVEGIIRKKHKRSRTQDRKGEIISVPFPVSISSVKLLCPACGKATRVGFRAENDTKVRMCKKCKKSIN